MRSGNGVMLEEDKFRENGRGGGEGDMQGGGSKDTPLLIWLSETQRGEKLLLLSLVAPFSLPPLLPVTKLSFKTLIGLCILSSPSDKLVSGSEITSVFIGLSGIVEVCSAIASEIHFPSLLVQK